MVCKISGKHSSSGSSHLKKADGTEANERSDIANTLAAGFEENTSSQHYTEKFKRFKALKEQKPHNFSRGNLESYNELFTLHALRNQTIGVQTIGA